MWIIYVWILGLSATNLFVLGSVTGFILGPLFGLSFAWINQKLNVIPPLLAAILCGCGLGSLILHKIAGRVQIEYLMISFVRIPHSIIYSSHIIQGRTIYFFN